MKSLITVLAFSLLLSGCSLFNSNIGDNQNPDWDRIGQTIQNRTEYVATFAFASEQMQPYKQQICATVKQIVDVLSVYNDEEATFARVNAEVNKIVAQIPDENLRNQMTLITHMVMTEMFDYAWNHYSDFIKKDEIRITILLAHSVSKGFDRACRNVIKSIVEEEICLMSEERLQSGACLTLDNYPESNRVSIVNGKGVPYLDLIEESGNWVPYIVEPSLGEKIGNWEQFAIKFLQLSPGDHELEPFTAEVAQIPHDDLFVLVVEDHAVIIALFYEDEIVGVYFAMELPETGNPPKSMT